MWNVVTRPLFDEWFLSLDESDQINVRACIQVLLERGPQQSRPYADTVEDSKHSNMKELRVQSNGKPIRAFFAFDPERTGIILCGGDKTGDKRFYKKMIPIADAEFDEHLEELKNEK
ncbi:type II toxin-antitoxin system RelE/ParE family toxin [Vibrio navarrensis]|uniref:type II toxin-antitoxin system RelE/ParE family toxin n=1 Tax=Vibrio navarrensis TaxID=29495 RepID=UPI00186A6F5D|nr:type II toxin-antitoxin system RelE/ParE family toxin [Vibrio navarrensis]MBE4605505.1 diaminopimelate decarboxylase [Vibrio navarrensis]